MGRKGWHHRGYLPHYDGYDLAQHIVFNLIDAAPNDDAFDHDALLDRGHGCAVLRDPSCAEVVAEALLHFDEERYALRGWCVMPNHVHALIVTKRDFDTGRVVRSWKAFTAAKINASLGRRGALWARDYFDRFMRDDDQYRATLRYIEHNPVAAGLCAAPEDWRFSSAGWRG